MVVENILFRFFYDLPLTRSFSSTLLEHLVSYLGLRYSLVSSLLFRALYPIHRVFLPFLPYPCLIARISHPEVESKPFLITSLHPYALKYRCCTIK